MRIIIDSNSPQSLVNMFMESSARLQSHKYYIHPTVVYQE